jgi:hypothetical protein
MLTAARPFGEICHNIQSNYRQSLGVRLLIFSSPCINIEPGKLPPPFLSAHVTSCSITADLMPLHFETVRHGFYILQSGLMIVEISFDEMRKSNGSYCPV